MSTNAETLRRADQIRARRLQRREGRPILARRPRSHIGVIPRMVARNAQVERRMEIASARDGRRRRYLKLVEQGAELRLPALPSIHLGWRAISGLTVAGCLFLLFSMYSSSIFTVGRAELLGAERLDANAVNGALQVAGSAIFSIQPDKLLSILQDQFPELETVSVHVGFPARVVVEVRERLPIIAWEQAGLTVWVDAAGVAFIPQQGGAGLIKVSALAAPPTLQGDAVAHHQLIRPEMVSAIQSLSKIAPTGAPLIYDPRLGFGWDDPGGWQAFFGQDGKNMDQRLLVYLAILNELSARRLTPTLISVAQLHAPYYRMDY